ncbi:hypothetical protein G6F22_018879 [Rhizopus arrhizus]|nr:hypothetical protein G6F22_018879 [Rhizopus arrhizus]
MKLRGLSLMSAHLHARRIRLLAARRGGRGLGGADLAFDPGLAQAFHIGLGISAAADVHFQRRTVRQRLGQRVDALLRIFGQHRTARLELDVGQFFAAAEGRGQQAERRRHGLDHQVQQHAHDDAAHREFGVVQRTRDRQVDVDVAARVLQQRHGQQHRQLGGVRAVGLVAKGPPRACRA